MADGWYPSTTGTVFMERFQIPCVSPKRPVQQEVEGFTYPAENHRLGLTVSKGKQVKGLKPSPKSRAKLMINVAATDLNINRNNDTLSVICACCIQQIHIP